MRRYNIKEYVGLILWCFLAVGGFTSCSDWTEVESLTIKNENSINQNPDLYQRYLQDLWNYRNMEHKIVIAGFENQMGESGRAHHLTQLPDSIDIVQLNNPDICPDWMKEEINYCREQKGMKFVYCIDFADVESDFKDYEAELEASGTAETADFKLFAEERVEKKLTICDTRGYDGIIVRYVGYSKDHLFDSEKEEYVMRQTAFLDVVENWRTAHADKMIVFQGTPQYLEDKYIGEGTLLDSSKYIILETTSASSASTLDYMVTTVLLKESIPTDRFIVLAATYPLDKTDTSTGRFTDGNSNEIGAVIGCAQWVAEYNSNYKKCGLAIQDTQYDYYNVARVYPYVRRAINIMNPSIKK